MHLNADFSERVVVRPADYNWVDSPMWMGLATP